MMQATMWEFKNWIRAVPWRPELFPIIPAPPLLLGLELSVADLRSVGSGLRIVSLALALRSAALWRWWGVEETEYWGLDVITDRMVVTWADG